MPDRFYSLDIFSGLGGNAFALRSIATPVLYCEIDAAAAKLLKNAMSGGHIAEAPVHGDICTLTDSAAYAAAKAMRPLLVSGSWPCQGGSKLGKRKGMDDPRSGLLRELCTLILDALPEVAVFENVPDVVSNGSFTYMKDALGEAYVIKHCTLKASDLGFAHERKRFFAALVRNDFTLTINRFAPEPLEALLPSREEPPRTISAKGELWGAQVKAFGNSIVPACLFYAVVSLLGFPVPPPPGARDFKLQLNPAAYTPPPGSTRSARFNAEGLVKGVMEKKLWATLRASDFSGCHVLTHRASHDLSTQLRFERGTPDAARGWSINPEWVAWLMGFPEGFTQRRRAAAPPPAAVAPPQPPQPPPAGDVVFSCGKKKFQAHRVLLALRAPGLAQVLESTDTVTTMGPSALARLLQYVYTGAVPQGLRASRRARLSAAAELFQVPALAALCQDDGAPCDAADDPTAAGDDV